jgi:hypothetical protein
MHEHECRVSVKCPLEYLGVESGAPRKNGAIVAAPERPLGDRDELVREQDVAVGQTTDRAQEEPGLLASRKVLDMRAHVAQEEPLTNAEIELASSLRRSDAVSTGSAAGRLP